jgi:hypothetical protein
MSCLVSAAFKLKIFLSFLFNKFNNLLYNLFISLNYRANHRTRISIRKINCRTMKRTISTTKTKTARKTNRRRKDPERRKFADRRKERERRKYADRRKQTDRRKERERRRSKKSGQDANVAAFTSLSPSFQTMNAKFRT